MSLGSVGALEWRNIRRVTGRVGIRVDPRTGSGWASGKWCVRRGHPRFSCRSGKGELGWLWAKWGRERPAGLGRKESRPRFGGS
jgi:hypothetical protein